MQMTYPSVTKPQKIFDTSSYFREVHLKNSKSKKLKTLTYIQSVHRKYKGKRIINQFLNLDYL